MMRIHLLTTIIACLTVLASNVANAQDVIVDVVPLSGNCDWAVGPDGSGLVVSTTDGNVADYLVGVTTFSGYTTAIVSVSDDDSIIKEVGDSGQSLAAPLVLQRGHEVAFAIAITSDASSGAASSSWASRSWLDDYSNWFNGTFGGGWSETVGGVIHSGLTTVISDETLANTSDGAILTGTVIVSVPAGVGILYGGEVVLGVGTFGGSAAVTGVGLSNAAIMRAFFTGQTLVQNPTTVAALYWYLQVARNVLARYQAMGYTGPGVATQTARIQQILEQLRAWGLQ